MNNFEEFERWYKQIHYLEESKHNHPKHKKCAESFFKQSMSFLEKLPLKNISNIIDIGCGYGYHCKWFSDKNKNVIGVGVNVDVTKMVPGNFKVFEMDMHNISYDDNYFDLIWSHHSLEHSYSPLYALREWRRVLKPNKYLAVTIPAYKTDVVSGHFYTGWNIGQLAYLLMITGYDVGKGFFEKQGYHVRALVKKLPYAGYKGISWIDNKNKFPEYFNLKEASGSLGRYYFNGNISRKEKE